MPASSVRGFCKLRTRIWIYIIGCVLPGIVPSNKHTANRQCRFAGKMSGTGISDKHVTISPTWIVFSHIAGIGISQKRVTACVVKIQCIVSASLTSFKLCGSSIADKQQSNGCNKLYIK